MSTNDKARTKTLCSCFARVCWFESHLGRIDCFW